MATWSPPCHCALAPNEKVPIMCTQPYIIRLLARPVLAVAFMFSPLWAASADLAQRPSPPAYRFEFLTGEDQDSQARDVNNAGTVVGTIAAPGQYWGQEVLWPLHGAPVPLEGVGAKATAVNSHGKPAGYWQLSGQDLAVVWSHGQIQQLPLDGNPGANAFGINDAGTVVGQLLKPNFDTVPTKWANGRLLPLPIPDGATGRALDINGWGQIVGEVSLKNQIYVPHAYLWTHQTAIDLHPSDYATSTAWAVNAIGQAAGWALKAGSLEHAGIWKGRHFTDLNGSARRSLAYGINTWGQVVGDASLTPDSGNTAVLWDLRRGKNAIDLNVYLPSAVAQAGWRLIWAKSINEAGVIVGDAALTGTTRVRGFRLVPLPRQVNPDATPSN